MSVNSKMTALADEIRELSGTTELMGLDAMTTHVGDANDEVASQVELLAQAIAALEGKAGGGGSGGSVETYTGTLSDNLWTAMFNGSVEIQYTDANMNLATVSLYNKDTITVIKGTLIIAKAPTLLRAKTGCSVIHELRSVISESGYLITIIAPDSDNFTFG